MEKDYKDQMAERAAKIIEDFDRLQEECGDLLKVFKEDPEEYSDIIKKLEWLCGGEENQRG